MTDRPEKSKQQDIEGPGIQLRRAREKRGLQLHDIAQELHLDEWMLQALEDDDFSALGAPVFAKGHMRKYGGMLGLDTDDLMIAYYRKRGRDDSPPPITKMMAPERPSRKISLRGLGWGLAGLAVVVALIAIWAFLTRAAPPQSPGAPLSSEEVADGSPDESRDRLSVGLPAEKEQPAAETSDTQSADQSGAGVQPAATADATPAPPPDNVPTAPVTVTAPASTQVRLTLTGESWVEVTDSDGKRLVYDMMAAGRTRTVSGRPPIEVFLGNSRSVQLDVDGQFYAIPRGAVRGNTARFVIGSDSR